MARLMLVADKKSEARKMAIDLTPGTWFVCVSYDPIYVRTMRGAVIVGRRKESLGKQDLGWSFDENPLRTMVVEQEFGTPQFRLEPD